MISSTEDNVAETLMLIHYMSPHCDFDLEDGDQSLSMTLWPMIMHHHTKFGYRRLSSSEHIVRMNIYCHFEPSL